MKLVKKSTYKNPKYTLSQKKQTMILTNKAKQKA